MRRVGRTLCDLPVALAEVLEERRLIKDEILSVDEGGLFGIVNSTDIHDGRAGQRRDYDAFPSTVRLTECFVVERASGTGS